ncbi:unnamed protein product [Phytophthora lilii]|uniref:Unnamed protein product n=1 Tax=Phytophthora lilii TaxID=2077276 RepID=A0A9W6TF51_9STRA|nr:unnamed protein product [Phytophthora lilii]
MIKWIWSLSEDIELDRAAQSAVDTGHLDVVMKKVDIESLGLRGPHIELDQACSNGHIAVVQWLIQHFPGQCCVMSADREAARKGRRDIVQLLHSNKIEGCSWQTIGSTASQGQVDIVKWLRLQSYYHQSDLSLVPMLLTAPHEMDMYRW